MAMEYVFVSCLYQPYRCLWHHVSKSFLRNILLWAWSHTFPVYPFPCCCLCLDLLIRSIQISENNQALSAETDFSGRQRPNNDDSFIYGPLQNSADIIRSLSLHRHISCNEEGVMKTPLSRSQHGIASCIMLTSNVIFSKFLWMPIVKCLDWRNLDWKAIHKYAHFPPTLLNTSYP